MSLFARDRRIETVDEQRGVSMKEISRWMQQVRSTYAGVAIDEDTAMRHDAVWSCVTAIAQDVSMMPVDVVRYQDGQHVPVARVPQIIAAPSATVSALDWRYQVIQSWLTFGNAVGLVTATSPDGNYPTRIELVHSSDVSADKDIAGKVWVKGEQLDVWPIGPVWHVPAYTESGSWWGVSPIAKHRMSIGAGLAAQKFGSEFFAAGGIPVGLLKATNGDPGPERAAAIKERFKEAAKGREVVMLPDWISYDRIQIDPNDSQFIDAMRYSVEQVCRIFREDPVDHGGSSGSGSVTYSNRRDADLARFKRRQFWVTKLQQALSDLLPEPDVVRLNTSSTLMMTPYERHELYAMRLNSSTITVNEIRRLEDEAPFGTEYDDPGLPGDTRDLSVAEAVQKVYLGVGKVLTIDEAREIVNTFGAALPVPAPPLSIPAATDGGTAA